MAVLSSEQIRDLVKKPRNGLKLTKAIQHEERLAFHATIVDDKSQANGYYLKFLSWVKLIITASDKYKQFEHLLTFPLATVDLIDEISDEYIKVFDAQNSLIDYSFTDTKFAELFDEYLQVKGDEHFWKREVFGAMMSAINSLVVVDLPAEQTGEYPEPYYYLLPIERVIDLEYNLITGRLDYVIFRDGNRIAAFDDSHYRVFSKDSQGNLNLVSESPHDLDYCPANYMWRDNIDSSNPYSKQSPISGQLGRLDWFLLFSTMKKSLDLYASYPIHWGYKGKCGYKDAEGQECDGGFTHRYDEGTGKSVPVRCPACESRKLIGPGSYVEVPVPRNDKEPDLRNPIGVVAVDSDSLNYNVEEIDRLESFIKEKSTGKASSKLLSKEALNEDQIKAQFESQTNILRYIAANLDAIRTWTMETAGRLMFGEAFVSASVNHGTEFYLQSFDEMTKEYETAKSSGLPIYILASKRKMLAELQAKNNPAEKDTMEIMRYLEPYPDMTIGECRTHGVADFDPEGYLIKMDFTGLLSRFELEFGSIVEFGSLLPMKTKIERINQKLIEYVTEKAKSRSAQGGGGGNNPGSGPTSGQGSGTGSPEGGNPGQGSGG